MTPRSEREQQPWTDGIVAEVRAAREQLLADCGHDLGRLAERLRAKEAASGRASVAHPRREPPKPVPA